MSRIGVDVDGVLADLAGAVCELYGIDPSEWDSWSAWKKMGFGSLDVFHEAMDEAWFKHKEVMRTQEENLPQLMERLMKRHTVMIISNRSRNTQLSQLEWIHDREIPYHVYVGNGGRLPHHIRKDEYPINMLIDDNPSEVERFLARRDRFLCLRDQPWNRDIAIASASVRRVYSFEEFVKGVE